MLKADIANLSSNLGISNTSGPGFTGEMEQRHIWDGVTVIDVPVTLQHLTTIDPLFYIV